MNMKLNVEMLSLPYAGFLVVLLSTLHAFVLPVASSFQYEIGQRYHYQYETTVRMGEAKRGASEVKFQVKGKIQLSNIWQDSQDQGHNILLLRIKPKLSVKPKGSTSLDEHLSPLDALPELPTLVSTNAGRITRLYIPKVHNEDSLNLIRGVVSLFQFQNQNEKTEEVDASGVCNVVYKISGNKVKKVKTNCIYPSVKKLSHPNKVLGAEITSRFDTEYEVTRDQGVILSAHSTERHLLQVQSLRKSAISVQSQQKLNLESEEPSDLTLTSTMEDEAVVAASKSLNVEFVSTGVVVSQANSICTENCKSLPELVKESKESLLPKNLAKLKSAMAFTRLLPKFRQASADEISKVVSKSKKNRAALLDIIAASQTVESGQVVSDLLTTLDADPAERFLLALAIAPNPNPKTLSGITNLLTKNMIKDGKVAQTAAMAVGAIVKTMCYEPDTCQNQAVTDAISLLTSRLGKCPDDACRMTYLRALQNAAHLETVDDILGQVNRGGKVSTIALQALQQFPSSIITSEIRKKLLAVYYEVDQRHESTSRLVAAELALNSQLTDAELMSIIVSLNSVDEFSTYLASRIQELALSDATFRQKLKLLKKDATINNYHLAAQPGKSTAFTNLLAETTDGNSTYSLHLELIKGGMLKHSVFDVHVNNDQDKFHILGFGMFASGLSSFSGGEVPEVEEVEEEMTAGMELTIMGVALRPYVLFTGQSDLMGHVWSGAGSTPTLILQGNMLLHDHWQQLALQSGLVVELSIVGALSIDMKGSIEISIWNRNSLSKISNSAAMLIHSSAKIGTSYVHSSVETTAATEASLEFLTNSEFYESPFKMCTQMIQPPFVFRNNVKKMEHIPQSKHRIRRTRKEVSEINGHSFYLHRKNSELCAQMLK